MAFRFIYEHADCCPIAVLCRKLGVTRGGYYAWRKRGQSQRQVDNAVLLKEIIRVHRASQERYGYPRVHQALRRSGVVCGRNRVTRLMRENGVMAHAARRFGGTTTDTSCSGVAPFCGWSVGRPAARIRSGWGISRLSESVENART
jgi:putative transposase